MLCEQLTPDRERSHSCGGPDAGILWTEVPRDDTVHSGDVQLGPG